MQLACYFFDVLITSYRFLFDNTFRIKSVIEEIELDEEALLEDLYSADRKFAEYYNVWLSLLYWCFCTRT